MNTDDQDYTPLDMTGTDFDWETLYRRLDREIRDPQNDPRLAEVTARLLRLLLPGGCPRLRLDRIGLRVIAMAWVLSPAYFPGSPSLRQLAARCGVSRSKLALLTSEVSRIIGWRNRAQKRAWNWRRSGRHDIGEGHVVGSTPPRASASARERPPGGRGSRATRGTE